MTLVVYAHRSAIKGRRADGTTIYGIVPQGDGSTFQWLNCGAASESERILSQTRGIRPSGALYWPPTPRAIRANTGDRSGGLTPAQTVAASYRLYKVPHANPRIGNWSDVEAFLWQGYTVDLLFSYRLHEGTSDSGSPGFTGNHRSSLIGIMGESKSDPNRKVLVADTLYDGRRSGITRGPKWIRASKMREAAGLLRVGTPTLNTYTGRANPAYFIPSLSRAGSTSSGSTSTSTGGVVTSTPSAGRTDAMIRYAYETHTGRVMALPLGQPLYEHPSTSSRKVTKMSRAGKVSYVGPVNANWGLVIVTTGVPYSDGRGRPTGLYVPRKGHPVTDRA